MKLRKSFVCLAGVLFLLAMVPLAGYADVPQQINYQGYLTDDMGNPVVDGPYEMVFAIYDVDSGGTELWSEGQTVAVKNGVYNVQVGVSTGTNPFPPNLFEGNRYLGITVGTDLEMTPRQRLTSSPFAMKAADADTLEGYGAVDFVRHDQSDSITTGMIATGAVQSSDILDNSITSGDLGDNSVGSSEIATGAVRSSDVLDNSLTAADLATNSVGSSEIASNAVGSYEIIAGAVGESEINWPLNYEGADLNGGLISLTNTSNGSDGNYPVGVLGGANGSPGSYRVIGVLGAAPSMGATGNTLAYLPDDKIGVAGASDDGFGVVGVSTSHNDAGVYGESTKGKGVWGKHTDPNFTSSAVYGENTGSGTGVYGKASDDSGIGVIGKAEGSTGTGVRGEATNTDPGTNYGGYFKAAGSTGRGVYGSATGSSGYGVYAYSQNGDGLYATTGASNEHAGYFSSPVGEGLSGAALYARTYNSSGDGIALWAKNEHSNSTDAAAVFSNNGSGPLIKGFGGDGGEHEFAVLNDGTVELFNGDHTRTISLEPGENGTSDGSAIKLYNSDGTLTIELDADYSNDGRIITDELQITGGSDLSEQFDIRGMKGSLLPSPGLVVSIDPESPGDLMISAKAYDRKVAGIISGAGGVKPGMLMGQKGSEADGANPVALTGRVYCWADATNGPIEPGDLLTTSGTPGHAMRVSDYARASGATLGKAMSSLKEGRGLVFVLVSLQ